MKKNWWIIVGIVLMIVGVAISYFGKFELADVLGLAGVMFGAGIVASQMWDKRDKTKPTWLAVVSIVLIAAGAFLLGFFQFEETTMNTIITTIFGLVAIIGGLVIKFVKLPDKKAAAKKGS